MTDEQPGKPDGSGESIIALRREVDDLRKAVESLTAGKQADDREQWLRNLRENWPGPREVEERARRTAEDVQYLKARDGGMTDEQLLEWANDIDDIEKRSAGTTYRPSPMTEAIRRLAREKGELLHRTLKAEYQRDRLINAAVFPGRLQPAWNCSLGPKDAGGFATRSRAVDEVRKIAGIKD